MGLIQTQLSSLPANQQSLVERLPNVGDSLYVFFIVDDDEVTGKPWCPDVRAAIPVVENFFGTRPEEVLVVSAGSRAE